jgi:hypothetical protein
VVRWLQLRVQVHLPQVVLPRVAPLRFVVAICLLIVLVGQWARDWSPPRRSVPTATLELPWVRTVDGWEQLDTSPRVVAGPATRFAPPPLHPLVVSLLVGLSSLAGLVAFGMPRGEPVAR